MEQQLLEGADFDEAPNDGLPEDSGGPLEIKPAIVTPPPNTVPRTIPDEDLEFAELKGELIDLTFVYTDFEETELGYVFILPEKKDVGLVPKKPMKFELHLLGKDPVTVLYAMPPTFFTKLGLKLLWLLREDE